MYDLAIGDLAVRLYWQMPFAICIFLFGCASKQFVPNAEAEKAAEMAITENNALNQLLPTNGLQALPSIQQVIDSFPVGRVDPFAPLPQQSLSRSTSEQAAKELAENLDPNNSKSEFSTLTITGASKAGGAASVAFISFLGNTGNVVVGDQGGKTTDLLPSGWRVSKIDVANGKITLKKGKQVVYAEC